MAKWERKPGLVYTAIHGVDLAVWKKIKVLAIEEECKIADALGILVNTYEKYERTIGRQ